MSDRAWDAAQEPGKRRLRPYRYSELANLPTRAPLVKGLLDRHAMSCMYGASNSGKTFCALDMALHVSLGWTWRGLKTYHGGAVYLALEGGLGFRERLAAFQRHHDMELGAAPFWVIPATVDLCDPRADTDELIREIERTEGDVDLIVVDTLSRAMAGGNENSSDDMGSFVRNCDRIRQVTGAHVLIVHHSGKDKAAGSRGHSSLLGAVDTEIEVKGDATRTATVTKQRDRPSGQTYSFTLHSIELGQDEDGDPITSCVVVPTEKPKPDRRNLNGHKAIAYDALLSLLDVTEGGISNRTLQPCPVASWRDEFRRRSVDTADITPDTMIKRFTRSATGLQDLGLVHIRDDYVSLTKATGHTGH